MTSFGEAYAEAQQKWPLRPLLWDQYARENSTAEDTSDPDAYTQAYNEAKARWPNRPESMWREFADEQRQQRQRGMR